MLSEYFSRDYLIAIIQAFFVTILWSSSWVIIKFGLREIPPLFFAGLRYTIGSVILLSVIWFNRDHRDSIKRQSKTSLLYLGIYGILFITITQGGQFIALSLLPAITVSFALNLTTFVVIFLSIGFLREKPSWIQMLFFLIAFLGILFYFHPIDLSVELLGLIVVIILVFANAISLTLGRSINRTKNTPPIIVTGLSMGFGSILLLLFALAIEGIQILGSLSALSIFYIVWLGVINTAVAFTIWNKAMQKLRAMDISIINSTMLPQIVILSIFFLGEIPILKEWIGLTLIVISTLLVQLTQAKQNSKKKNLS